jgi:DNA repair protein RadD
MVAPEMKRSELLTTFTNRHLNLTLKEFKMSEIKLRPHQLIAADKTIKWLPENPKKNGLVGMPTASGKTYAIAETIRRLLFANPRTKVLVLTHSMELVANDEQALLRLWRTAPVGVYCSSLRRKEIGQITIGSIGSVANKHELFGRIDFILIDEVHCVSHDEDTQYRKLLNNLKEANENLQVVGYSASPYRMGGGCLTEGHIFDEFVVDMTDFKSYNWFFNENYLSKITSKQTKTKLDVSNVKMTKGDFNQKELQIAIDKEEITRAALTEAVEMGFDRNCWLVFGSSIEHVEHISNMLNVEFNISSTFVHSKMTDQERTQRIGDFKAGKYTACVNNLILTTGVDIPQIDFLVVLLPTASPARHVQVIGRILRIAPKEGLPLDTKEQRAYAISQGVKARGGLVADFAGNTARCGAINDIIKPKKKGSGGGGEAPVKTCKYFLCGCNSEDITKRTVDYINGKPYPMYHYHDKCDIHNVTELCNTIHHPSAKFCECCGGEFIFNTKLTEKASMLDIVATKPRTEIINHTFNNEWLDVTHVSYGKNKGKMGKPDTLKVSYMCGYTTVHEYIGIEHGEGERARGMAYNWWKSRIIGDVPKSIDDALVVVSQLATPERVQVKQNGKYLNVVKVEFADDLELKEATYEN